ncbi:MAG: TonB-dependent receptor [Candidatus Omnitrophica bacterium]|nr:TonB-dependent receptor [Candidatus Omnitrophota bacterium]MBU4479587.1 TonB-dependent receptor [Candidatus Omnitrophota bacterium]MCG2703721.1 TonB-dependent receptor [Candidatus Omnitrophota bacterium]
MFKRRKSASLIVAGCMLCSNVNPALAEDVKKPLLQLPQVDIVGKRNLDPAFIKGDFKIEEFLPQEDDARKKDEVSTTSISNAYGRFATNLYDIIQTARAKNFYYTAQLNINDVGGERPNSRFTTYQSSFTLGFLKEETEDISFTARYFNKIMELPGPDDAPTLNAKRKNNSATIEGTFRHSGDGIDTMIQPYYTLSDLNDDVSRPDFRNKVMGARMNIEADETVFDVNVYQDQLEDYYEQMIAGAKIRLQPFVFGEEWRLVLGANLFAQEEFGQRTAPFAEMVFQPNDDTLHKLTLTREFEPVVFTRTYLDENYVEVNTQRLRPRRKAGISYQLDKYVSPEWRTNLLIYARQDKDLWFWDDVDSDGLYAPQAIERVNFAGIKLSTEYTWTEAFSHFFSLTVRRIRSKDSNYEFVPFEPKQRISLGMTYKFTDRWKLDMVGDYFGRRYFEGNSKESSSAYFLLGSKLTYEVKDYLTFFVLVDNVLNDHYDIVRKYPNQSTSAVSGFMIRF